MPDATPTPGKRTVRPSAPANSLRLDAASLTRLLDQRDQAARPVADEAARRDFVRWPFRSNLAMMVMHPGGSHSVLAVACRNLSSGGIAVLHSAYMHRGTRCAVSLPQRGGGKVAVPGTVVRCSHLAGTVHELGIRFDQPIDCRETIELDPFDDAFQLEAVRPERLRGVVVYFEPSPLEQRLVRHFLRDTEIDLRIQPEPDAALHAAREGAGVILCGAEGPGHDPAAFIRTLRGAVVNRPVLVITSEAAPERRAALAPAGAGAVLVRPLKQETLLRALAEYLILGSDDGAVCSVLPAGHANAGLLEPFIDELRQHARAIEEAIAAGNTARARSLCQRVAASAPVMGFPRLAEVAEAAERSLGSSLAMNDSAAPLRALVSACRRAQPRLAA